MPHLDVTHPTVSRAKRLVIKVGSSSLTRAGESLNDAAFVGLAHVVAALEARGCRCVVVTSGAVAAGLKPLGLVRRPDDLATQQAAASAGQSVLIARYQQVLGSHDLHAAQVLLTSEDVMNHRPYQNARRTLHRLWELGVVPVVNENDTVATHEMRFGDNDRLAALVAHLVDAEALLLVSDVPALLTGPPSDPRSQRVARTVAEEVAPETLRALGSAVGTGGMATKVEAARIATGAGIPTLLTDLPSLPLLLAGEDVGTEFAVTAPRPASRRLWLAHASATHGTLVVDDGARRALVDSGASLLAAGIVRCEGVFASAATVRIVDLQGVTVARGIVAYGSDDLSRLMGRTSVWLEQAFGRQFTRAVVHRDNLALVARRTSAAT